MIVALIGVAALLAMILFGGNALWNVGWVIVFGIGGIVETIYILFYLLVL